MLNLSLSIRADSTQRTHLQQHSLFPLAKFLTHQWRATQMYPRCSTHCRNTSSRNPRCMTLLGLTVPPTQNYVCCTAECWPLVSYPAGMVMGQMDRNLDRIYKMRTGRLDPRLAGHKFMGKAFTVPLWSITHLHAHSGEGDFSPEKGKGCSRTWTLLVLDCVVSWWLAVTHSQQSAMWSDTKSASDLSSTKPER